MKFSSKNLDWLLACHTSRELGFSMWAARASSLFELCTCSLIFLDDGVFIYLDAKIFYVMLVSIYEAPGHFP